MNMEDVRFRNCRWGKGVYFEAASFVPADNFVLTVDHPPLLFLTPAGAIDILMPTSTLLRQGLTFFVHNLGGATITFKTDGDAAFATAAALATTQNCIMQCTGSTTQNLGWRKIPVTSA
jgi:hypothetical protein